MATRRQFLVNVITASLAGAGHAAMVRAASSATEKPLELGVLPYRTTRALFELMQPVADFMSERLRRRTILVTAPSLREFDLRFLGRAYELAYVSPHTARIAQQDLGMWPLLQLSDNLYVVVLVLADSPFKSLRDLASKRVLTPDRFRASYYLGKEVFAAENVSENAQVQSSVFQETMIFELQRGNCDAVVMNHSILLQMPQEQRQKLRILGESRRIPNAMFVAAQESTPDQRRDYTEALLDYFTKTQAGRKAIELGLTTGLRPVTQRDLELLDSLANAHRKLIEEARGRVLKP